ncbi:MAG: NRDE family protein [Sphingomonas sp.]
MCVLALAWQAHPRWRLVVAANRDEYHDRAAAPLARWPDDDGGLIAGRDLRAGGTWLAVRPGGRFAAVTNIRNPAGPDPTLRSRGALVADLAGGAMPAADALAGYNPFNAVVVSAGSATFLGNRPHAVVRPLGGGLHAMSNGPLDPPWRKTTRLTRAMADWLDTPDNAIEQLFACLRDPSPPDGTYDDPTEIFIADATYGTRCSTIVTVDRHGAGRIVERRYDRAGATTGETAFAFAWG